MAHASTSPLERRLRRLERSNRLLTFAIAGLGGLALLAFARPPETADVVQARRFQVVDERGLVRLELMHDTAASALYIRDQEGVVRVGVAQFSTGAGGVALHGAKARGSAVLYLKDQGSLTFYDSAGAALWRAVGKR